MTTAHRELAAEAASCAACGLAEGRTQVVFGNGSPDADVMFVGEAPGAREDEEGVPFVGRSGQLLDRLLAEELGMVRSDVYIANVVNCRPPDNRDPRPDEIVACRPWLARQMDLVDPSVVVTLETSPLGSCSRLAPVSRSCGVTTTATATRLVT